MSLTPDYFLKVFLIGGTYCSEDGDKDKRVLMADTQRLEGTQPVDLSKHPSGIVPTLQ